MTQQMNVAYIFPPPWDPTYPPYAMALFAASTKRHLHNFFGFDLNVDLFHAVSEDDRIMWKDQYAIRWKREGDRILEQYSDFLDAYIARILNLNITLYAFYTLGYSKQIAFFVARKINKHSAEAAIILGGPQECFPAYDGVAILENDFVDAICTGEGDSVWPAILDGVSKQGNLHIDMPGVAYKASDGTIVNGGVPKLVDDLDTIPCADYSSIDFAKYGDGHNLSTMTSRGCINTCAFCSERPNFHRYRHRSAENIFKEIVKHLSVLRKAPGSEVQGEHKSGGHWRKELVSIAKDISSIRESSRGLSGFEILRRGYNWVKRVRLGFAQGPKKEIVPHIHFNDSLINGSPRELESFCDLIIERDIKFAWGGMALLGKEMTKDLLTKMKKAGCGICHGAWSPAVRKF